MGEVDKARHGEEAVAVQDFHGALHVCARPPAALGGAAVHAVVRQGMAASGCVRQSRWRTSFSSVDKLTKLGCVGSGVKGRGAATIAGEQRAVSMRAPAEKRREPSRSRAIRVGSAGSAGKEAARLAQTVGVARSWPWVMCRTSCIAGSKETMGRASFGSSRNDTLHEPPPPAVPPAEADRTRA